MAWIVERDREGATLLVADRTSHVPTGLVFLGETVEHQMGRTVRLGYLMSEMAWSKGLATELVGGFVEWCRTTDIASIVGGVERRNVASQRVPEKNGFVGQADNGDGPVLTFRLSI